MSSRVQSTKIALGVRKQADIATATAVGDMVSFTKLNSSLAANNLGIEDDAAEYGKGDEFGTEEFTAGWDVSVPMEKYGTSQFLAWAYGFCLGNVTPIAGGYTIVPSDPGAGLELPYFTYVEQIPGTDDDQMAIGNCIEDITHTINSGPGRQNNRLQITAVGSGKIAQPSGITIPAPLTEVFLPAGIATVTINGVDYVLNKNLVSVSQGWKNNCLLSEGFFPGSGFQTPGDATTGQIRGRIEMGVRTPSLSFVVRVQSDSSEADNLASLTTGPATIALPFSGAHAFTAAWARVGFKSVRRTDSNGIATVAVTCNVLKDTVLNKLLTITALTDLANVAQ
jgi:hypothetical protein